MKEHIATIRASEDRGSLMDNVKSRSMWRLSEALCAPIFLLASTAEANTASMAVMREAHTPLEYQREQCLLENELARRHNELSYSRNGSEFTIQLR